MSKKVIVYNFKTGDPVEVCGIDAREYVNAGGWSMSPPGPVVKPKAVKGKAKKVDVSEVDKEIIKKTAKK